MRKCGLCKSQFEDKDCEYEIDKYEGKVITILHCPNCFNEVEHINTYPTHGKVAHIPIKQFHNFVQPNGWVKGETYIVRVDGLLYGVKAEGGRNNTIEGIGYSGNPESPFVKQDRPVPDVVWNFFNFVLWEPKTL